MSRDPYGGSIYDPASLHRYNYARANPVNYVDPSGRSNLTEYALDLSLNTIATGGVVTSLGFSVKCAYFTVASSLHLVGETLGQQVDQFTPLFKSCAAKITTTQFVTAWAANTALLTLNVLAGPALRAVGDWMFGAEQGMDWRLLTEEEGSIGPRGPWNINANDPVDLEAFQRLNTLDSATGQLRPGEAGVAAELENYTGSTMQRAGAASGPDFEFTSGPYNGQTVDMMYTPSTVEQANNLNQYFNQNLPALEENLTSHASKADLVAIDMRVLSSQNQASMMNAINSLPSALQSKFILLW